MGSLCSKAGTHSGGHTVLGSSTDTSPTAGPGATQSNSPGESPEVRRQRLAEAALTRQQKDMERLTNKRNPNAGRLASQVNKPVRQDSQQREEEPLRWD